jgi:hypothetical protein
MLERGWSLHSFSRLPAVFSKSELVTPYYYQEDIRPFAGGVYGMNGCIGVIHQEFEEIWTAREENRDKQSQLPVCLLIANIKLLRDVSYVNANSLARDMNQFVTVLTEILGEMPQSEEELKAAFKRGQLYGRPIEDFSGWSQRPKFAQLRTFVEGLPR